MTKLKIFLGVLVVLLIAGASYILGCGRDHIDSSGIGNAIAKKIGGSATVKLPPNTKLVNVSWKTAFYKLHTIYLFFLFLLF